TAPPTTACRGRTRPAGRGPAVPSARCVPATSTPGRDPRRDPRRRDRRGDTTEHPPGPVHAVRPEGNTWSGLAGRFRDRESPRDTGPYVEPTWHLVPRPGTGGPVPRCARDRARPLP